MGKRILLVSHFLGVTGAPISLLRHAQYMLVAGYDVDVWSMDFFGGDNGLEDAYRAAGLHVRHVDNDDAAIQTAIREVAMPYDLAICNTICTYKCVKAFQSLGIPTIWFIRETALADKWAVHNVDFCNIFKRFNNLYCPAEYTASQIHFYNRHVRIVRNAIKDDFAGYAPLSATIRFGFIGSINPIKGVDLLVDAFENLHRKHVGITLTIAGGTKSKLARSLVERTKSDKSVTWIGEVKGTDKKRFFDTIDILCVPSLEEPFGLTVAEGAMYGKIVITTDRTGARCFPESIAGAIVKADSVHALERAMSRFLSLDRNELRRLQEISRANYLKYGTMDHEREAVLKMVSDNIGKSPTPPKRHRLDEILIGRSLLSKISRRIRRSYLNFALMLVGRGDWNKRAARCT